MPVEREVILRILGEVTEPLSVWDYAEVKSTSKRIRLSASKINRVSAIAANRLIRTKVVKNQTVLAAGGVGSIGLTSQKAQMRSGF